MVSIAIIGAGPAGCELARRLSSKYEIFLIDRNSFPRNKPCGGILIEESVEFLKDLSPPQEIFSKPKELNLIYRDLDNSLEFKQDRGFCNVDRKEFDFWLFKLATSKSNVKFTRGAVNNISFDGNFSVLVENNKKVITIKSDIVVDASGAYSITKKLNFPKEDIYVGVQFELRKDEQFKEFFYIFADSISDYYSWIIPKKDMLLVGSCFNKGKTQDNIEKMKSILSSKIGINFEGGKLQVAPIIRPLTGSNIQLIKDNFFIIGEAAGLVSPSTGEGISYALRSAKACAEAINDFDGDIKKTQKEYLKRANYLAVDIKKKMRKAKFFMDSNKRVKLFKTLQT